MTSRISFPKLVVETLRRHLAAVLVAALVFIIKIITFFLNIQNEINMRITIDYYASSSYPKDAAALRDAIIDRLTELTEPDIVWAFVIMFVGVYLAYDFFRYLHSKKKTDFYDALPIQREQWFSSLFVASFGVFFILCITTTLLEIGIVYAFGYGSYAILQNMFWDFVCLIGSFLVGWVTTALAMIMTGHSLVALLGFGAFATYIPYIIGYLVPTYANMFFETYVYESVPNIYNYFSPFSLLYKAVYDWDVWSISKHWPYLIGCYAFAGVIGTIAYLLFLRRPSEAAGRAMAFDKINFIIRFLLVIPLSLYVGYFLSEMSSFDSIAWLIFGVVASSFLIHGLIECIFNFDLKSLISKKKQLIVSIVIGLAFVFVFWIDLFRYDAYLPDANDVKAIYIASNIDKYDKSDITQDGITGEYIDEALAVAKDIKSGKNDVGQENAYMTEFEFTYVLKNGSKRQRRYTYNAYTVPESFDKLYATAAFKDDYCVLYHLKPEDVESIKISNGPEFFDLDLKDKELQEFFKIYLEELTNMTYTQSLSNLSSYEVVIEYPAKDGNYTISNQYRIYDNFTKTLEFLKKYDIVSFKDSTEIEPIHLQIYDDKYTEFEEMFVVDPAMLAELKQHMIIDEYFQFHLDEQYAFGELRYKLHGKSQYINVHIEKTVLDEIMKRYDELQQPQQELQEQ